MTVTPTLSMDKTPMPGCARQPYGTQRKPGGGSRVVWSEHETGTCGEKQSEIATSTQFPESRIKTTGIPPLLLRGQHLEQTGLFSAMYS